MAAKGLLDRFKAWREALRDLGGQKTILGPDLSDKDVPNLIAQMQDCLNGRGGDVSARNRALALGQTYLSLDTQGRLRFLKILSSHFAVDPIAIDKAIATISRAGDKKERDKAEEALKAALEAPRLHLLRQFTTLPQGVKFLVDMRAEILAHANDDQDLDALERDLKHLLSAWFDIGFLELHRLTWNSPAALLEKIIAYEAVHAIHSWQDLKNRLDTDRRLFAFFHPRMADEPLIFVEVALVRGMADNVQILLDPQAPSDDPQAADCAVFYSISNAQKGLAGISFGNFLIKKVVDTLRQDFPNLKSFVTLSPIPGLRSWVTRMEDKGDLAGLTPAERQCLQAFDSLDASGREQVKSCLLQLTARYLSSEHRTDGRALDAVAHFHLTNGARLERINWMADTSPKGLKQSFGLMVNYAYRLDEIEDNHEAYSSTGKIVSSKAVKALLSR